MSYLLSVKEERIIFLLKEGFSQAEIALEMTKEGWKGAGLWTIEKNVQSLKREFNVETLFQLGMKLKQKKLV